MRYATEFSRISIQKEQLVMVKCTLKEITKTDLDLLKGLYHEKSVFGALKCVVMFISYE